MTAWVFASRQAKVTDACLVAQLQIDATLAAYGRMFPASAPPPLFDDVHAQWRGRLGDGETTRQTTLVAVDDGQIVGVVVAGADPVRRDRGHVARFYVAPDRWGQGIGRHLYRARSTGSDETTTGKRRCGSLSATIEPAPGTNGWGGGLPGSERRCTRLPRSSSSAT